MTSDDFKDDVEPVIGQLDLSFIHEHSLCHDCLGRLFAKFGRGTEGQGMANRERGHIIADLKGINNIPAPDDCWLCEGLTDRYPDFAAIAVKKAEEWDHSTFLIGSKFDTELAEREELLWSEVTGEYSEPMKAEFNREVGKLVHETTMKEVEFNKPDLVLIIDSLYESVEVQVAPLYIYGRYVKLVRGIPQTRWPCRECQGKGCERCNGTGKMYSTSVEEIIGQVIMEQAGGKDHRFHGMGREDIDALMKGDGRPFILEIKEPNIRRIDFDKAEKAINDLGSGVGVNSLRPSEAEEVIKIKDARPDKRYSVKALMLGDYKEEKLKEVVLSLGGSTIEQQTPTRVKHRRADKVRKRTVLAFDVVEVSENTVILEITAEAGTYIKELVHGDGGRTVPSLAGDLGVDIKVEELDVLEIIEKKGLNKWSGDQKA